MSDRVRQVEDNSRMKRLRIMGLDNSPGENSEQIQVKVNELIEATLELTNIDVKSEFRIGRFDANNPRPIIAKLRAESHRQSCFRVSSKLRGTKILDDDVSRAS